jgi:hypothetical protein
MGGKKRALSVLLAINLMGIFPGVGLAETYSVDEGTPVRLALTQTVNSSKNKEGDRVEFKIIDDILALDGRTVLIEAGTIAWGSISEATKRGRIGNKGELALQVIGTKAVNGATIPLRASISREGQNKLGTVVALSVLISPLFLFMRGKDAKILAGTELSAYVDRSTPVELAVKPSKVVPVNSSVDQVVMTEKRTATVGNASVPSYLQKYVEQDASTNNETLQALDSLLKQGLLSQEEYQAKKQILLQK